MVLKGILIAVFLSRFLSAMGMAFLEVWQAMVEDVAVHNECNATVLKLGHKAHLLLKSN
jgi:hypothetical protein